jgi:hypothetical protein
MIWELINKHMATKPNNPFQDVQMRAGDVQRSVNWYQAQVRSIRNIPASVNRLMSQDTQHLTTRLTPGRLYLFQYDALHADTLPYWDAMPLVFPFRKMPDGFLGLNLHYLPYGLRFKLMGALLDLTVNTPGADHAMVASYNMLSSSSRYPGVRACVKHYLKNQLRSSFLNIPADQWLAASMMPLEQFQGATKDTVWRQSRKVI